MLTGRRQYLTVLEWLLDVRADTGDQGPHEHAFGAHHVSSDALVMVLEGTVVLTIGGLCCLLAYRAMVRIGRLPQEERILS